MSRRIRQPGLFEKPTLQLELVGFNNDEADLSTYTYPGLSLGTPHPDRYIIACSISRHGAAVNLSSLTIGGVATTVLVEGVNNSGGNRTRGDITILKVPTGLTADVVVNYSSGAVRNGIVLLRTVAVNPTAIDSSFTAGTDPAYALDIPIRGIGIAVAYTQAGATPTWTGLTEIKRIDMGGTATMTVAGLQSQNGVADLATQCTWSSNLLNVASWASFGL